MSRTADFPEGLLVHILGPEQDVGHLIVRRKPIDDEALDPAEGPKPKRVLLSFDIYDPLESKSISDPVLVTLVGRYFPADFKRSGDQVPTLLLWDDLQKQWIVAEELAQGDPEQEEEPAFEVEELGRFGIVIIRGVEVADPPAAWG